MKRAQKLPIICVVVLVTILALLAPAQAQLAARGPISPDNGFPLWYDDGKGLALQQCFDETTPGSGTGPCILPTAAQPEPFYKPGTPIDTTPTTVNLVPPRTVFKNFPTENFYASAITDQTFTVGGQKAFVLMALEATFANILNAGNPLPVIGDQTVFQRIRMRITPAPLSGVYVLEHPWGVASTFCTAGARCEITIDLPVGFAGSFNLVPDPALGIDPVLGTSIPGSMGPFVTWDPAINPQLPPALVGYIGDGFTPHEITGSPLTPAQNFVRIIPPSPLAPVTANKLIVSGKRMGLELSPVVAGTDFGLWKVNSPSTPMAFTVTNRTGGAVTPNPVTSSNPAFTIPAAADTCSNLPVAAGATCTFDVVFTPQAEGAASGTISVSAPGVPAPVTATVSGSGDGSAPLLAITGISRFDKATSQTITGTVSDNHGVAGVQVAVNGGPPAAATVTGGTWSFAVSGLTPNTANSIAVIAGDIAQPAPGNQTTVTDSITVDTIAPAVAITVTSPTRLTSQTISGSASDANGISVLTISVNGSFKGNATVTAGSWNFDLTGLTPNASNSITAVATDPAGNQATATASIVVDTVVSPFTIAPVTTPTIASNQGISGTVEAGSTVNVTVNGGNPAPAIVNGTAWSFTVSNLQEGPNGIEVSATDSLGNTGTLPTTITRDTQVSPFTLTPVPPTTSRTKLPVGGTIEAGATVQVALNGGAATAATVNGTSWSITMTGLNLGSNNLAITATDSLGNSANRSASFAYAPADGAVLSLGDTPPTSADSLRTLQFAINLGAPLTSDQKLHADVAPLGAPDSIVDTDDALLILRKVVGLVNF